jgi:YVTN family beta-propeller protein
VHKVNGSGGLLFSPDNKHLHYDQPQKIITADQSGAVIAEYPSIYDLRPSAISPDGQFVYANSGNASHIYIIDTQKKEMSEAYQTGKRASRLVVSNDGERLFVGKETSNGGALSIIDIKKNTSTAEIPIGSGPFNLVINRTNTMIYVACWSTSNETRGVYAVNLRTHKVIYIRTGRSPWGMAFSPDEQYLYVTNFEDSTLTKIDTLNNGIMKKESTQESPREFSISNDGKWAYMTAGVLKCVFVIDTSTLQEVRTIDIEQGEVEGVYTRKDTTDIWVVCSLKTQ